MKTSFHINTFWFHVTWDRYGKRGIDQHGRIWINAKNPIDETGVLMAGKQQNIQFAQTA